MKSVGINAAPQSSAVASSQAPIKATSTSASTSALSTAINDILYKPDLVRMTSAYSSLTPDCDTRTKALYRIAPAAREARHFPEIADDIHRLLRAWASGELAGTEAKGWLVVGSNGLTGEQIFEGLWQRFVTQTGYSGKETTLGSVYHAARAVGWTHEEFESISGSTVSAKAE